MFGFKLTYNNLKTLHGVLIFLQLLSVAEECHTISFSLPQFFLFSGSINFHQRFSCHLCQAIVIFQHFLGTGSPCKGGLKKYILQEYGRTVRDVLLRGLDI